MNRSERRKQSKDIKSDAIAKTAFELMLSIPVMVIRDKYSHLMKREVNGKSREERFAELCLDLYGSFEKGHVTLDDLRKCLWEEAGIKIERGRS